MRKKRRKRRHTLRTMVLLLTIAVAMCAMLYLYPAWRAAKVVRDNMGLPYSSFDLEVELDRERMPQEQVKMFGTLARLTGMPEEALYRFSMKGNAWEDKIHLLIYPDNGTEPLFEFYLSSDTSVINETILYNAIRSNLTGQFGLLEYLMPSQEETLYMTLEQVEQLFGVDIGGMGSFELSGMDRGIPDKGYFLMLALMSREKQGEGYRFALEREQIRLGLDVTFDGAGERGNGAVKMRLQIQNPSEALKMGKKRLPGLGSRLPAEALQGVKSLSMTLTWSEEGTITIPTNMVNQETIEIISRIRAWIQETFG